MDTGAPRFGSGTPIAALVQGNYYNAKGAFRPLVVVESKGFLHVPWITLICVYPRSSAVLIFLRSLRSFAAIASSLFFAALRLCVRIFPIVRVLGKQVAAQEATGAVSGVPRSVLRDI